MMSRCRSCGAPIRWAKTAAGKRMPLDVEPVRSGNVQLGLVGGQEVAIVVGPADAVAAQAAGIELYQSHFATCPNGAQHRKPKEAALMPARVTVGADYFTRWTKTDPESGCLIWQGHITAGGYGRLTTRPIRYAHRVAYETFVDDIPEGLEIDHLCQNPSCVNPLHLEAVTAEENDRRIAERRTHCKHGHPFDDSNTRRRPDGSRACRACERARGARRRSESPTRRAETSNACC